MSVDFTQWQSMEHHDEPRDQMRDLFGPYWASVGPEDGPGWSWTITDSDLDNADVTGGRTDTEEAAKQAVGEWEILNRPNPVIPEAFEPGDKEEEHHDPSA
jgi:hypothetical protein